MSLAEWIVSDTHHDTQIDVFLVHQLEDVSRARTRRLIDKGSVHVNGHQATRRTRVHTGDRVELSEMPEPSDFDPKPDASLELHVVFEDPELVVIDKPPHKPSHPLRSDEVGTIVNALIYRYPEMGNIGYRREEAGLVHRLDTATSGLLVAARNAPAFEFLRNSLREGQWEKNYWALCSGAVLAPQDITLELRTDPRNARRVSPVRKKNSSRRRSHQSHTKILRSTQYNEFSLVEVSACMAGRHQVRAHLAAIGHPLAGDLLYGGSPLHGLDRHFLHACLVDFPHPLFPNKRIRLVSDLPKDLQAYVRGASAPRHNPFG